MWTVYRRRSRSIIAPTTSMPTRGLQSYQTLSGGNRMWPPAAIDRQVIVLWWMYENRHKVRNCIEMNCDFLLEKLLNLYILLGYSVLSFDFGLFPVCPCSPRKRCNENKNISFLSVLKIHEYEIHLLNIYTFIEMYARTIDIIAMNYEKGSNVVGENKV